MILGFHAGSLLLHDESSVCQELSSLGFTAVAIRPRLGALDPSSKRITEQCMRLGAVAKQCGLTVIVDTEGRYIADPRRSRWPSLASRDSGEANKRIELIRHWLDLADEIGCSVVTFTSGLLGHPADESDLERLAARIDQLTATVPDGVKIALHPMVGDAIPTVSHFERLKQWLGDESRIWVAADVGEMLRGGEFPVGDRLARNLDDLACVYLCEPDSGQSRDCRIGHGEVDFSRIVLSLKKSGYQGPMVIRVDGHHERGFELAVEALAKLESSKHTQQAIRGSKP